MLTEVFAFGCTVPLRCVMCFVDCRNLSACVRKHPRMLIKYGSFLDEVGFECFAERNEIIIYKKKSVIYLTCENCSNIIQFLLRFCRFKRHFSRQDDKIDFYLFTRCLTQAQTTKLQSFKVCFVR